MLARPETATLKGFYLFARSKDPKETYRWSNVGVCAWAQYMQTLAEPVPAQRWIHPPYARAFFTAGPRVGDDPYAIPFGVLADRLERELVANG